ncbi:MAG: nucleoside-diphosphate kinase [Candidatus Woesearchaeota archaeon]
MREHTLVLLKPDAVQRGIIGEIISRFERCGMKISAMKMVQPNDKLAGNHYADDEEWLNSVGEKQKKSYELQSKPLDKTSIELGQLVRQKLISYLMSSPIIALVLTGHNAVLHVRKLVGETSPQESRPGTIRGDFSFDTYQLADYHARPIQNLIHASSSVEEAKREIQIWFEEDEIHTWKKIDEELLYGR